MEESLQAPIDTAVSSNTVEPAEFERLIVGSKAQEKTLAHLVGSRLPEIERDRVMGAAMCAGIALKQTFAKEGRSLSRCVGGYAHVKQFNRLRKVVKGLRTILRIVLREVQHKIAQARQATALTLTKL